eukprot:scaffold236016_cov37-Prasinocladus_malaysianus.AAC.1
MMRIEADTCQALDRGRVTRGLAMVVAVSGQGSPGWGASASTGHHSNVCMAAQNSSSPPSPLPEIDQQIIQQSIRHIVSGYQRLFSRARTCAVLVWFELLKK